jgi:copper chaperone CopZ
MKTIEYAVEGMTCSGCVATVQKKLSSVASVKQADVSLTPPRAIIQYEDQAPSLADLNASLGEGSHYHIAPVQNTATESVNEDTRGFLETYKPLLLIVGFILGGVALAEMKAGTWNWHNAMTDFMGGFFVVFSFFKFLNLKGFVDAYRGYDILAKRSRAYAAAYPFIELALGIAYLMRFQLAYVNLFTAVIMTLSLIGVVQSVLNKRTIQCACLGTVFNLPMSTVTIVEDGLMVLMAATMLIV